MIEIATEQLLTLAAAARLRPPTRAGRPTHPSTLARWALRGIRGHHLEVLRIGGTLYTSAEALQRFADRLTNEGAIPTGGVALAPDAADRELARRGF
jgi:hypothetical protein